MEHHHWQDTFCIECEADQSWCDNPPAPIELAFLRTSQFIAAAVAPLELLRSQYVASQVPDRKARLRSIDSKIDALKAVKLDASAYPWSEDEL